MTIAQSVNRHFRVNTVGYCAPGVIDYDIDSVSEPMLRALIRRGFANCSVAVEQQRLKGSGT
jgi:hypothetical protein